MINADCAMFDASDAFGGVSQIKSSPPKGTKETRKETRYKASWEIAIEVEGRDLYEGRIKDISLHGMSILNGLNLKPGTIVKLHIYIPPLTGPGAPRILVIHGKVSYTVHDVDKLRFRVGIAFVKFERASDRAYLEERLTNYHSQVLVDN